MKKCPNLHFFSPTVPNGRKSRPRRQGKTPPTRTENCARNPANLPKYAIYFANYRYHFRNFLFLPPVFPVFPVHFPPIGGHLAF